jgi:predicted ATPase/DNA-binding SARP family transcriptional activator
VNKRGKMEPIWRIQLLGGLKATLQGVSVSHFGTRRTAALLSLLAMRPGHAFSREVLAAQLWPGEDFEATRVRLRQCLTTLRHILEPEGVPAGSVLCADRLEVRLAEGAVSTDVEALERAARMGLERTDNSEAVSHFEAAIELYAGPLLPGYEDAWIISERTRLAEIFRKVAGSLLDATIREENVEKSVHYAQLAVSREPLDEVLNARLLDLYWRSGRHAEGARHYRELEARVAREFSAPLSEDLKGFGELLKHEAPLFPSAGEISSGHGMQISLPTTRFFGREEEIERICHLTHPPDSEESVQARLVTITGAGGSGKTRIASEIALRLQKSFDGALWFVPLADVSNPELILRTVADEMRLPVQSSSSLRTQIIRVLSQRPSLLILDNYEQLVEGGAALISDLLHHVPGLSILVTSRQLLNLEGEHEVVLLPLPTPIEKTDLAALTSNPSLALFVDRAQASRPGFHLTETNVEVVGEICRVLEGIPLAIELAAAWSAVLSPEQILERLSHRFDLLVSRRRDIPARHRTLREAIDSSYRLLSPELQRLFAGISVFRGGCTLEAVSEICEAGNVLEQVARLREMSLIVVEESSGAMRYRQLETLREYASEQLTVEEKEALSRRHALRFLSLAEEAFPHLAGLGQVEWLVRLEGEHENIRAALGWAILNDPDIALNLGGVLWRFWWMRGHLQEGRNWLERALERRSEATDLAIARGLCGAAVIALSQGDRVASRRYAEECLSLSRTVHSKNGVAASLGALGFVSMLEGDPDAAGRHFEECLVLFEELEDLSGISMSLISQGFVALWRGEYAAANNLFDRSLVVLQELRETSGMGMAHICKGFVSLAQGEMEECRTLFDKGLGLLSLLGDRTGEAMTLVCNGFIGLSQGDFTGARPRIEEGLTLLKELGNTGGIVMLLITQGCVALLGEG